MLDRLFGRGKQDRSAEPTCSVCGRTLLPGEWAQTIVHDDGTEEIVCSLCSQTQGYSDSPQQPYDHGLPAADQWPVDQVHEHAGGQAAVPAAPEPAVPSAAACAATDGYTPPADAYAAPADSYAAPADAYDEPTDAFPIPTPESADAGGYQGADTGVQGAADASQPYRTDREEGDALWRALKDKDAEIARLQGEVLRLEAERHELDTQLTLARQGGVVAAPVESDPAIAAVWQTEAVPPPAVEQPSVTPAAQAPQPSEEARAVTDEWASQLAPDSLGDSGSEDTVGLPATSAETAAIAAALTASQEPDIAEASPFEAAAPPPAAEAAVEAGPFETVPPPPAAEPAAEPIPYAPAPSAEMPEVTGSAAADLPAVEPSAEPVARLADAAQEAVVDMPTQPIELAAAESAAAAEEWCPVCDTAEISGAEAQAAVEASEEGTIVMPAAGAPAAGQIVFEEQPEPPDMDLLQRGADLFNVSSMPQKVAETNELLGLPIVNLAAEGKVMTAVFMWSMAWYQYSVDLDGGDVKLDDRGYEERADLRANGIVRSDGTIQIAPVPTRRPVVQAPPPTPEPAAPAEEPAPVDEPDDVRPVDPGKGEFISKSLKGQRTDDEAVAWDEMAARDFDWGH